MKGTPISDTMVQPCALCIKGLALDHCCCCFYCHVPNDPASYSELGVKAGYPLVMNSLLGPGLKGILIVSFLAAFMSTIDTHLNWGASYLINDVYKRFFKPNESEKHYVFIGKDNYTVVLMILAAFTALKMQSISKAWEFIFFYGSWNWVGLNSALVLVENKCLE